MWAQALEKLLLAEGSKMVMLAFQSTHAQGVYGLVTNLGSLVVRTIFQVCTEVTRGAPFLPLLPYQILHGHISLASFLLSLFRHIT